MLALIPRMVGSENRLPSLAERRSDIGRLLVHFLERELEGSDAGLSTASNADVRPWPPASLVARLARYDWPGNVRQLANVARRLAIVRRSGSTIALEPFIESLLAGDSDSRPACVASETGTSEAVASEAVASEAVASEAVAPSPVEALPTGRWRPVYRKASEVSEDELIEALRAQSFVIKPTAEALGVSRAVLYRLIEGCPRVRKAADLGSEEIREALAREGGDLAAVAGTLEVSLQGLKHLMKTLGLR